MNKAHISILDRGLLYGDGVFETMRAYKGKVFKAREHLERLYIALRLINIKISYSKNTLETLINKTLKKSNLKDAYIRLTVTRGIGGRTISLPQKTKPTVIIFVRRFKGLPESFYKKGVKVDISCFRINEYSPVSKIKSLNYLNNILARHMSRTQGFDDTIFTNSKGFVTGASASNVFLVKKGKIFTPDIRSGILPGITRKTVIDLSKGYLDRIVEEGPISVKELLNADEIFLTNSLVGILPVIKVGHRRIGKGVPGSVTAGLRALYRKEINF